MKNLSRKETCWAILQQVPTYLIAVLSLLICGFLTVASLFSLAVMRMDEIPVLGELPEQLVLADRNVLHVAPVVAVLSILLLLLARQNFTWKHAKIVTWVAAAVQTWASGGKVRLPAARSRTRVPSGMWRNPWPGTRRPARNCWTTCATGRSRQLSA